MRSCRVLRTHACVCAHVAVYTLVTHRGTVQGESTTSSVKGNFSEVARALVARLAPAEASKLSYEYDKYMFHYIVEQPWSAC